MPDGGFHSDATILRLRLWQNGFAPIPVKSPDHPSRASAGKAPVLEGWQRITAEALTHEAIEAWRRRSHETNTGLVCGRLVAVDLDTPVTDVAERLRAAAFETLGPSRFIRIGRAPKLALLYRAAEPIEKLTTPALYLPDGTKLLVEILGAGQQLVGFGIHPDTQRPYEWPDASPLDHHFDDLPEITPQALSAFRSTAEGILLAAGGTPRKQERSAHSGPTSERRNRNDGGRGFPPPTRAEVEDALRAVPNTCDWDGWVAMGGAIYAALGESGRDLFDAWSATSSANKPEVTTEKWGSFRTSRMKVPADYLFKEARSHGWKPKRERPWGSARFSEAESNPSEGHAPEPDTAANAGQTPPAGDIELTEHGVALAFADRFKDRLRYCHTSGSWYVWTGTHWAQNETRLAFDLARRLVAELNRCSEAEVRAATGRANFAAAVERFAQADRTFAVTASEWDCDPWLLGTPGGVVNLRTGLLRKARREDLITKVTAVAPAATAECPLFLSFLHEACGRDKALVGFLQRWFGYCLTGVTREHALLFVYGPGGNGKGVLIVAAAGIMGTYAITAAMDTFTALKGHRHTTDLAMLRGARLVIATETEEGQAWAEARIKALTGGDPITARFMRCDNFTFMPAFKLTISGNHKPTLRNVDDAARRRFNIVPFVHKPTAPDKQLSEKLKAEWPGILRWMIEGCSAWQKDGLQRPGVVLEATKEYFADEDVLAQWIDECCDLLKDVGDTSAHLFASWRAFALSRAEDPRNAKWFGTMLERHGYQRDKDCEHFRGRGFRGIRVRPEPAQPHWQDRGD